MQKIALSLSAALAIAVFTINLISRESDRNNPKKQRDLDIQIEKHEQDLKNNELFPFEKIKANSQIRRRFVDLETLPENLKPISKSFFEKWLKNTYVDRFEKKLKYQLPIEVTYSFYDFAETDQLFLFSIIASNSDQAELIHFTCDKTTGEINHAEWIAANENKGGYSNHSKLEYSADRLTLVATSEILEPVDRHWETYTNKVKYIFQAEKVIEKDI